MPVPKHTFAPPFNIVRSSHIALGVSDLGRSRAFYADTLGLIVEDAEQDTVYLRGVEERQHHSLVLQKVAAPVARHLGFKVGSEEDLDKAAEYFERQGIEHAFDERPYQGRTLTAVDPYGSRPNSHSPWKGASDCCSVTRPTAVCSPSGSTTSTCLRPTCKAPWIFTPHWDSA